MSYPLGDENVVHLQVPSSGGAAFLVKLKEQAVLLHYPQLLRLLWPSGQTVSADVYTACGEFHRWLPRHTVGRSGGSRAAER